MEAYRELFRHKRNEEKRHELITCFENIWTAANIFGRRSPTGIKWNTTPHQAFLPRELGAWITPPIQIRRNSPSPDVDAEFVAQSDFSDRVHDFLQDISNNWRPPTPPGSAPPLSPWTSIPTCIPDNTYPTRGGIRPAIQLQMSVIGNSPNHPRGRRRPLPHYTPNTRQLNSTQVDDITYLKS